MTYLHLATAVAAAGATLTPTPEPVAEQPLELTEAQVLALETERYRRMTVPVRLEGEGPFRFMVDTGAQATVLSNALADQLGKLERRSVMLVGLASRQNVEVISIDSLELGERSVPIHVAPLVRREHIGGADGILGIDSLQDQRVLLDFENSTMSVAEGKRGSRGYEIVVRARRKLGQLIITQAKIDRIKVAVVIDTGAQGSLGNPALQERLRRGPELGEAKLTDVHGAQLTGQVRLARSLQIGRAELSNIPLTFAESPTFEALGLDDEPALILGMSELKLFNRVAIDFESKRILFDLPQGNSWPERFIAPTRIGV